ncbi:MAG: biotin carboxylase, partial [Actinobacteria bacterium]|nr:biotin carboxylase [Actinomycetota bacterium]
GFRRELDAVEDPDERAEREQQLIDLAYQNATGFNVATFGEIDDVLDPAETRGRIVATLAAAASRTRRRRPGTYVPAW